MAICVQEKRARHSERTVYFACKVDARSLRDEEGASVIPPSSLGCLPLSWSGCRDLNPGPLAPKASALPTALHPDEAIASRALRRVRRCVCENPRHATSIMRPMKTRQARLGRVVFLSCFALLWGCSSPASPTPTLVTNTATVAVTTTPSPTVVPATATPTTPACASLPGTLGQDSLATTSPPQQYLFYLPPCYFQDQERRYPVLYLLHGQTFTDDQWVRIGATAAADRLIIAGETPPFIIVLPDDRGWNLIAGAGFGDRLIALVAHIDSTLRTTADRADRALGGLSRGGGWAARLGFTRYDQFGAVGLHSPAIFTEDAPYLRAWIQAIPAEERPRLWIDIGDRDRERFDGDALSDFLAEIDYPHEFHLYAGDHTENYWGPHVEQYLRWYAAAWDDSGKND